MRFIELYPQTNPLISAHLIKFESIRGRSSEFQHFNFNTGGRGKWTFVCSKPGPVQGPILSYSSLEIYFLLMLFLVFHNCNFPGMHRTATLKWLPFWISHSESIRHAPGKRTTSDARFFIGHHIGVMSFEIRNHKYWSVLSEQNPIIQLGKT